MGVKGLWKLLHPVARPVQLEQLSDKVLAVDASIWLHQFIKALKDKEGKTLNNAHILGFFRRICKFLFHNIKPVFVFDGATPSLKAHTIQTRRKRRITRQENVQRTAKKILAAQMHLNAINAVQTNENQPSSQKEISNEMIKAVKFSNYEDRTRKDEYILPPEPTNIMDDYRLASKEELHDLIRYDMDINEVFDSKYFQSLPVEVQHKIVYEMKNKSRQNSYDRIEKMIEVASSALDFSKLQIKGAIYRNKLTEALHQFNRDGTLFNGLSKNIASERNNEYILIKNDDKEGGWSFKLKNENDDENKKKSNLENLLNFKENFEDTLNKNRLAKNKNIYTSSNTYKKNGNGKVVDLLSDNSNSDEDDENIFERFYKVGNDNENLNNITNDRYSFDANNPLKNPVNEQLLKSDFTFPLNKDFIQREEEKEEEKKKEMEKNEKDKDAHILTTPEREKIFNEKVKKSLSNITNKFISQPYTAAEENDTNILASSLDLSIDPNDTLMKKSEEDFIEYWVDAATFDFKIEHPDFYNLINDTIAENPIEEILKEWENVYLDKINKKLNPVKKEDSDASSDSDIAIVNDEDEDDEDEEHPVEESSEYFYENFLFNTLKWKYCKLGKTEIPVQNEEILAIVQSNKIKKNNLSINKYDEPIMIEDNDDTGDNNKNSKDNNNNNNNEIIVKDDKSSDTHNFLSNNITTQDKKEKEATNEKVDLDKILFFEDEDLMNIDENYQRNNSKNNDFNNKHIKIQKNINSIISIDDDDDVVELIDNNKLNTSLLNNSNYNDNNNNKKYVLDSFFFEDDNDNNINNNKKDNENNQSTADYIKTNSISSIIDKVSQKSSEVSVDNFSNIDWNSIIIDSDNENVEISNEKNKKEDHNNNISLEMSIPIPKQNNNKKYNNNMNNNNNNNRNNILMKLLENSKTKDNDEFFDDTFDIIEDEDNFMNEIYQSTINKEASSSSNHQTINNYDFNYQLNKLKKFNQSNKKENEREKNYSMYAARKRKLNDEKVKNDDHNSIDNNNVLSPNSDKSKNIIKVDNNNENEDEDEDDKDEINFLLNPVIKKSKLNTIEEKDNKEIIIEENENKIEEKKNIDTNIIKKDIELTESPVSVESENENMDQKNKIELKKNDNNNLMNNEKIDFSIIEDQNHQNQELKKLENKKKGKEPMIENDDEKDINVNIKSNENNNNYMGNNDDDDFIIESQEYKFEAKNSTSQFSSSINIDSDDSEDFDEELKQIQNQKNSQKFNLTNDEGHYINKKIENDNDKRNEEFNINTLNKYKFKRDSLETEISIESKENVNEKNETDVIQVDDDDNDSLIDVNTEIHDENIEYARMISEISKKDISTIQNELEEEISNLKIEKLKEQKGSEDITSTMIYDCQELLRLFGIPYIVSPMEAEAQCATLYSKKLVDGIVTDDSDIFLFGGSDVYKNMFNQHQYVECYKMTELEKEMKLNRKKLINMAYLLGSDYTEGLKGFGIVHAMEIIKEWPGDDGLIEFKQWWEKRILNGEIDPNENKLRKRIYKQCRKVDIPDSFPDPQIKNAYLNPVCDESDQAFVWGTPDLKSLKKFLNKKLLWDDNKINNILVPIIKKMEKNKMNNNNDKKQTKLDQYFFNPKSIMESNKLHQSQRIKNVIKQWSSKK